MPDGTRELGCKQLVEAWLTAFDYQTFIDIPTGQQGSIVMGRDKNGIKKYCPSPSPGNRKELVHTCEVSL